LALQLRAGFRVRHNWPAFALTKARIAALYLMHRLSISYFAGTNRLRGMAAATPSLVAF
jgi:hypothetical protein